MCISAGYAGCVMALTSSHFASAEKEFRFPLEYAGQRPLSTTWTVTGAGAFLLASEDFLSSSPSSVCITGITTGKIVDYGVKDSMHMGAAMAPAAADTIARHLHDTGRTVEDYDRIITGDLGQVGDDCIYNLRVFAGFAATNIDNNLVKLWDLHNRLVFEFLHHSIFDLIAILFM